MIGTALGAFLALLLPAAAGSGLVSTLWPGSPRILRIGLGTGIGLGLAGAAWTLALTISGSAAWSLLASEGLLLMLAAALLIRPRRNGRQKPSGERPTGKSNGVEVAALVLASLFCIGSAAVLSDASPHGGYDATAIWNSKARIFYLHERPLAALPDLVFPDYPILTPAIITRGWQYSQTHTVAVPVFVALFFTTASVLVLVGGLRRIVPGSTAFLAGCLALGTPFFLESGASQYADIVMCFFITSSSVLLLTGRIRESGTTWLPLLAGICAGLAACTKNEGNLFVLAMVLAQSGLLLWNRRWKADGIRLGLFFAGLIPGILSLTAFKLSLPEPNVLFANMTLQTVASAVGDGQRHFSILKGFARDLVYFGNWWVNPLLFMLLYAVLLRIANPRQRVNAHWQFPATLLVIMLCGYYGVYLFTPYPLDWHIQSSLPRLLTQLWPTALALWALLVTRTSLDSEDSGDSLRIDESRTATEPPTINGV